MKKLLRLTPALLFMAALNVLLGRVIWKAVHYGLGGMAAAAIFLAVLIAADYGFVKLVRES